MLMRRSQARTVVVAGFLLVLAGCRQRDYRHDLRSANPLDRAAGIRGAVDARDRSAVPRLVGLLDDDDPAVRMYAILALERLTGQTYGYRYYARPAERETAVERWRQALREGTVAVTSSNVREEAKPIADRRAAESAPSAPGP